MSNIVAIVGRPNVGKSTLFNRLIEERKAIVDETAGVTRDRQYGHSDWNGKHFSVIDTGGYVIGGDDEFDTEIRKQVALAIDEADVILFLVDAKEGLTPMDEDVADMLRRCKKKVLLVVNKCDTAARQETIGEFYALGLGELYPIAGITGSGTGDLLDTVVADFDEGEEEQSDGLPRIAVVGRPNVGKSSFINAITGTERNIVTPIAGTTRDSVLSHYNLFGFDFNFVDTAGLRKKSKVSEDLEFYSVLRSVRAIEASDVCILMLDASQGLEQQDLNIFGLIQRNHKGVVIVVNNDGEYLELVNPVIAAKSQETVGAYEGCLSVPDERGYVERPQKVIVKAQDRNGNAVTYNLEDMAARAACHETDHLDGTLFVDLTDQLFTEEQLEEMLSEENED